ncbi:MAG: sugar ABC transporter substrate-binding protein [Cellulosilyticaceae bacterium]
MKKRKLLSACLAMSLLSTALIGCSSDVKTNEPSTTPATEDKKEAGSKDTSTEQVTIKVATWDATTTPLMGDITAEFEKLNPNIKVELIDVPAAEYPNKLSIMLNGGSDVDAFYIKQADTTLSFHNKGQLADLSEYVKRDNIDLAQYNGLAENFIFEDKIVGLPHRSDYYVLYYNKDIFDAAGLPYPSNDMTWQEFEETAKKLTTGEGADKNYGAFLHTWNACVQNWAVAEGDRTIITDDYSFFKPYYEMAIRMQNEDKSIMDFATAKTANIHYSGPFLSGDVGMMPMGTWFMGTIISKINEGESDINWGVATIPHADSIATGNTVGATTPVAINNASKKKDAAWEYVKFVSGPQVADMIANTGGIPAISNEEILTAVSKIEGMPEGVNEALAVVNINLDRPISEKAGEVNKILEEEHGLIMLGETSIDDGLKAMQERVQELIK